MADRFRRIRLLQPDTTPILSESTKTYMIAFYQDLVQQLDLERSSHELVVTLSKISSSFLKIWEPQSNRASCLFEVDKRLLPLFIQVSGVEKILNLFIEATDSNVLFFTLKTIKFVFGFSELHTHWVCNYTWALSASYNFITKLITLTSNRTDNNVFELSLEIVNSLWSGNFYFLFKYFTETMSAVVKHVKQLLTKRLADDKRRTAQKIGPELADENRGMFSWCQTFSYLCRESASIAREVDGMATLMLLIESSNPKGSKVCPNLCGLYFSALMTASSINNFRCLIRLLNLGLVYQLTPTIVKHNRKYMGDPRKPLNARNRHCFTDEDGQIGHTLAAKYKELADPSYVPTFPDWQKFEVVPKFILNGEKVNREKGHFCYSFPVHAHHLSLRMLYKWGLCQLVSPLIQPDVIYAIIDYVTQTPYPNPIAFKILMVIARSSYQAPTGIVDADKGRIPFYIAKRFNIAAGITYANMRCRESCSLHRALTILGLDLIAEVSKNILKRPERFVANSLVKSEDWTLRTTLATSILFSSLKDLTGIGGFNAKSLDLILATLKDDAHMEEALISLSSLASNLGIEALLCPWTPTLKHVFIPCRCRVTSLPDDSIQSQPNNAVYFTLHTLPGVSGRLNTMLTDVRHRQPVEKHVSETLISSEINSRLLQLLKLTTFDGPVTSSGTEFFSYETTSEETLKVYSISTVGVFKELLSQSTPYFNILFGKIASNHLTVGSTIDEPIVLPEVSFDIFGPVIHAIYGCGSACSFIQSLCSLMNDQKTAREVLCLLRFFGAEKLYQRATDVVATQRVKPENYVDLLLSLDDSVNLRRCLRHALLMPLLPISGLDLPFRLALVRAVLKSKIVFECQGQVEIKVSEVYLSVWRSIFAKYLQLPATDAERRLAFITEPEFLLPAEGEPGYVVFTTRQLARSEFHRIPVDENE